MHEVWQAGVSLYPACVHTGMLCPFPSLLFSPAFSSTRQDEEGKFFVLLSKTFKQPLSLFAGFLTAGTYAFKMFLNGYEQIKEIKKLINN